MNILEKILDNKRKEVSAVTENLEYKNNHVPLNFKKSISGPGIAIIAEIKFKSPSEGVIYKDINPVKIAKEYENAGANALSILTDCKFFGGDISFIEEIKEEVSIPIIQKDFIISESQIIEGANAGADCFLIISEALEKNEIISLIELIEKLSLSFLLEVHSINSLKKFRKIYPDIVGVNSRDLKSMKTNLKNFKDIYPFLPKSSIKVAESGIKTSEDINYVEDIGYDAILIGTSLMKSGNPGKSLEKLIGSS